jgi:hypothetical protein
VTLSSSTTSLSGISPRVGPEVSGEIGTFDVHAVVEHGDDGLRSPRWISHASLTEISAPGVPEASVPRYVTWWG